MISCSESSSVPSTVQSGMSVTKEEITLDTCKDCLIDQRECQRAGLILSAPWPREVSSLHPPTLFGGIYRGKKYTLIRNSLYRGKSAVILEYTSYLAYQASPLSLLPPKRVTDRIKLHTMSVPQVALSESRTSGKLYRKDWRTLRNDLAARLRYHVDPYLSLPQQPAQYHLAVRICRICPIVQPGRPPRLSPRFGLYSNL